MSQEERNKETLRRLFEEVVNPGNLEKAGEFITVDRPDYEPNLPPEMTDGLQGFQKAIGWFKSLAPDFKITPQFMIAEGDKVLAYNLVEGTNTGEFMGKPATNKSFQVQTMDVCRFNEDGLIAEHWGAFDMMNFMKQLGRMQG